MSPERMAFDLILCCTDHEGVMRTYGFASEDALNDPMGAVDCEEGRVVAFPNILQHCVQVLPSQRVSLIYNGSRSVRTELQLMHASRHHKDCRFVENNTTISDSLLC
jgi:hypothetical protein